MSLAPEERALLLEEVVGVPVPSEPNTSEPEELQNLKTLPLYLGEDHHHPLALPFHGQMSLAHPHWSRQTGP